MQSTELITRYVNAVGENLPKKQRADIQAELQSLLTETLDARAESEGRPVDQSMTVSVLREFGDPPTVAQRYAPSRPLISPAYFPLFSIVVKIVVAVMSVLWIVGLVFAIGNSDGSQSILEIIWQSGLKFVGQLLANFGLIVIIFAVMEHYSVKPPKTETEPWDPVKLPAVQNPNRVDRTDAIFTIVGNVIVLGLLNWWTNGLTGVFWQNGTMQTDRLFGPAFFQYVPLIILSCLIELVLYTYVLFRGTWTRVTRILEIGSGLFAAFIVALLLVEPQPLAANPVFEPLVKIGLLAVLVIVLIDVGLNIYRLVTKRWSPPSAPELELVSNG